MLAHLLSYVFRVRPSLSEGVRGFLLAVVGRASAASEKTKSTSPFHLKKAMASGGAAGGGPTTYKVLSISVMRWNNDTEEPILLEAAYNLAEYSFFTRGSVKEFLTFASRTVMKRVTAGSQALDYEGNIVYCVVQPDGLGVIVITDKSYPGRVALKLARETLEDFKALHG